MPLLPVMVLPRMALPLPGPSKVMPVVLETIVLLALRSIRRWCCCDRAEEDAGGVADRGGAGGVGADVVAGDDVAAADGGAAAAM